MHIVILLLVMGLFTVVFPEAQAASEQSRVPPKLTLKRGTQGQTAITAILRRFKWVERLQFRQWHPFFNKPAHRRGFSTSPVISTTRHTKRDQFIVDAELPERGCDLRL